MIARAKGLGLGLAGATLLAACTVSTGPSGPFADVQGEWDYTGVQASPVRNIAGTLTITAQTEDQVAGQLSYSVSDGIGGIENDGGAVVGRVIGLTDIDFDVVVSSGSRQHVAQISANGDTLRGIWLQPSTGTQGTFVASRGAP